MSVSLLPLDIGAHMGPGGSMMGSSYLPLGGFFMFLFPLLLLVGLFLLLRRADRTGTPLFGSREGWVGGPGPRPQHPGPHGMHHSGPYGPAGWATAEDEAMRTLNNRLAAGDIDPEDYRQRVDTLRNARAQANDPTAGMPYLGPEDQPGGSTGQPGQPGPQA